VFGCSAFSVEYQQVEDGLGCLAFSVEYLQEQDGFVVQHSLWNIY
jgi:predicted TPR repeat methyltransferase